MRSHPSYPRRGLTYAGFQLVHTPLRQINSKDWPLRDSYYLAQGETWNDAVSETLFPWKTHSLWLPMLCVSKVPFAANVPSSLVVLQLGIDHGVSSQTPINVASVDGRACSTRICQGSPTQ